MANDSKVEMKIEIPEEIQGGVYANNMVVIHSKEEFMMDFIMVSPTGGRVNSRVILSPGHMKRIIKALQNNVQKYEKTFGKIAEAKEPEGTIGFTHTPK